LNPQFYLLYLSHPLIFLLALRHSHCAVGQRSVAEIQQLVNLPACNPRFAGLGDGTEPDGFVRRSPPLP